MNISIQVLDSVYGQSAVGVGARLQRSHENKWITLADAETNDKGCIEDWRGSSFGRGVYRIVFDSDSYFARLGAHTAYPEVIVIFRIPVESYSFQVQMALAPFSYSTHFGTF